MTALAHVPRPTGPSRLATFLELRAPLDWATVLLRAPQLLRAPRGDGRPVMLLPGFATNASSMRPLGGYLRFLGYDVYDWGLGRNDGKVDRDMHRVGMRARALSEKLGGAPVTLIGWSLGGVIAREAARLYGDSVREVITLGTPIIGGPKYTRAAGHFAANEAVDLDAFEIEVHERNLAGLSQPVTSIYSRLDGIVGWRASVDVYNEQARNIQVYSSHFGIGINGRVWRLIADILAGK